LLLLLAGYSVKGAMKILRQTGTGEWSEGKDGGNAAVYAIVLSQFCFAVGMNIVISFMPFYILDISKYSPTRTMVWIGLIMGLNSFVMAAVAPFWGSLTAKYSPKLLYERVFLISGVITLLMGFTQSLPLILALRIIQGVLGGASTIGLFMVSRLSLREKLAGNLSLFQNSITAGQLLAPPVGAYVVVHMGYAAPFILSAALIAVSLLLCHLYVSGIAPKQEEIESKTSYNKQVIFGWVLSFIATVNLTFLPSILPNVLAGFSLKGNDALKAAGFIMMGYTATAILGNYLISNLTPLAKIKKTIVAACLFSAFSQIIMYFAPGVFSFAAVRMLQTGAIAAVISLVMAEFAGGGGGAKIGFLNSARFAGNGAGPLLATFVLARANLLTLYIVISLSTVGSVLAFLFTERQVGRTTATKNS
jgi:DHA1 family multidrug resistance protein-like MFS transporter